MPTPARRLTALALAAAAFAAAAAPAEAQLRAGFRSTLAPRGDDTVTPFAAFGFSMNIRGGTYNAGSACMNGYVAFGVPLDATSCVYPGIAGAASNALSFLSDVHGTAVAALYRDLNSGPAASGQLGYGGGTVDGRQAFGFTWDGVFNFGGTAPNFFQLIFVNRAADFGAGAFDVEYNYGLLASTGNAAAGVTDDGGFSGTPYTVAVTAAPNSRTVQCFRGGSVAACGTIEVIPEPSTVALTVVGLGALAGAGLRRRRAA
jgi:hypothetical protein